MRVWHRPLSSRHERWNFAGSGELGNWFRSAAWVSRPRRSARLRPSAPYVPEKTEWGVSAVAPEEQWWKVGSSLSDRLPGVKGTLEKTGGYRGDVMNLPVRDLAAALPFYERVLGFSVLARSNAPHASAVLGRDQMQIGFAENGGDPAQDGAWFHVKGLGALFAEFNANGLDKTASEFSVEQREDGAWRVFFVVAPDGLCYWFGERASGAQAPGNGL